MKRLYPRSWPYRNIVEEEASSIQNGITEEQERQSASGNVLWVLDLFVSWKASDKVIDQQDVVRFLIKVANKAKLRLRCFVAGINCKEVQRNAHYHAIVGFIIPATHPINYAAIERAIKAAPIGEVVKRGFKPNDPHQQPYSEAEYIVGKHNFVPFKDNVFTPRKSLK